MSEPYLFPMEFSGDPCRNMMVEVVLWSGYCGRRWESDREECLLYGEKMEKKKKKKKKKKKERSKWVAGQESKDTYEMCGLGEWGRWGHTCGSLKYLTFFFFLFFLYSWIELGRYKRCRVGSCGRGKTEGKKEKKKKKEMGWVGCGASCQ